MYPIPLDWAGDGTTAKPRKASEAATTLPEHEEDVIDPTTGEIEIVWRPRHVRLTGDAAIASLCIHESRHSYRTENLAWDFDFKGEIRKTRVPHRPTITISQNGLPTLPVWKDWYIFTGGCNTSGWLRRDGPRTGANFTGGLVLPQMGCKELDPGRRWSLRAK
ncbi:hypothetical protein DTO006G1_6531 [Penicillium roqueforti]|nr:uncharacterized protein LCP9604111_6959 [Penicillium roqueforti]KAF9245101.1 hypothetical protein LCP9604111_6959 [Penicillium roqueforti]KAI1833294.1 hypothetical protein CBS147337_5792 [Penicillium roqueforti]KAI2671134.1 hypothetical protein LCP963914a_9690 [Penicillium roqueforti]KAI2671233.1 hypothetical protein CBS147355_8827 [Penicillium roqueforti]KAI2695670.1 hypothetical protein CBS147372_8933 [Penicillium roqueforti]